LVFLIVEQVMAWSTKPIKLMIGVVPMSVHVETPVSVSLDVSLTSTVIFSSSIYTTISMKSGYRYSVNSNPVLQQISKNSAVYGGSGLSITSLCGTTASLQFGITPMAQFILSFVGGPVSQ
jgi:hypothetical protein